MSDFDWLWALRAFLFLAFVGACSHVIFYTYFSYKLAFHRKVLHELDEEIGRVD